LERRQVGGVVGGRDLIGKFIEAVEDADEGEGAFGQAGLGDGGAEGSEEMGGFGDEVGLKLVKVGNKVGRK
jgi:hypothetical protein